MGKITDNDAARIRRRLAAKEPASSIAEDYNVSAVTIRKIGRGLTHRGAGGPLAKLSRSQRGDLNGRAKLSNDDVEEIKRLVAAGESSQSDLAKTFGVSPSLISRLCRGQRWNQTIVTVDDSFMGIVLQDGRPGRGSTAEAELVEQVFRYYRSIGYPTRSVDKRRVAALFEQLRSSPSVIEGQRVTSSSIGLKLANAFHPHIDFVRCNGAKTPPEVFGDDDLFHKAIRKHIRYGSRLTPQGIRYAVYNYGGVQGASNFRPTAAKSIIELLGGRRVLDPCMGFGGRLLGAIAAGVDYVGIDPASKTIEGNRKLVDELRRNGIDTHRADIVKACAEDVLGRRRFGRFDLVLTSPPYFDTEIYDSGPDQSAARYPTFSSWRRLFLHEMIRRSSLDLTDCGLMALNVSPALVPHVRDGCVANGLREIGILEYELYVRQFRQPKQGRYRSEPVLLMQKVR